MTGSRFLLMIVLVALAWHFAHSKRRPTVMTAPPLKAEVAAVDPCVGKDRCVVIFLAPWCPACKGALPQFLGLRERWRSSQNRAVKFVIGAGAPEQNAALAKEIGEGAYVDEQGAFQRQMAVVHYPTIWVIDRASKVLARDNEAYSWLNEELRQ